MSYIPDTLYKHFRNTVIIWDNLQGHKGLQAQYEREHPHGFHFERLPTCSPELNVMSSNNTGTQSKTSRKSNTQRK
jgi:hypothetical protein